ncbi:MAG TPA: hypothetical protein EYO87_10305 [Paracoccus sp.]|nr:hypothetical protein [Paracoccus sp. (in: a-proteobacteria)]
MEHRCQALRLLLGGLGVTGGLGKTEELHSKNSADLWREIRDAGAFLDNGDADGGQIWRLSVAPMDGAGVAQAILAATEGRVFYDWGGGLVWLDLKSSGDAAAEAVRGAVSAVGGHATLVRAAPDSVKAIAAALRKEKLAGVEKEWLRALGAAGADDRGARKTLLKAASKEKDELLRVNALLALGNLAPGSDRDELLTAALEGDRPREQAAAVCAAAMTRNEHWLEILIALTAATDADAAVSAAAEAAVKVIEGGALSLLAKPIRDAGQDTIARKRIYGG